MTGDALAVPRRRLRRSRSRAALSARPTLPSYVGKPIAVGIRPEALDGPAGATATSAAACAGPRDRGARPGAARAHGGRREAGSRRRRPRGARRRRGGGGPRARSSAIQRRPRGGCRPARIRLRASGRTSRSSWRSTSASCTSSTSTAGRRSDHHGSRRVDVRHLRRAWRPRRHRRGIGFFAADTRFLSRLVLTVDGVRGEPVSFEQAAPHVADFELRGTGGARGPPRAVRRARGLEETITVENVSRTRRSRCCPRGRLRLRRHPRGQTSRGPRVGEPAGPRRPRGPSTGAGRRPARVRRRRLPGANARAPLHTPPDEPEGRTVRYRFRLASRRSRWQLVVAVQWLLNGTAPLDGRSFEERFAPGPARAGRVARAVVAFGASARKRRQIRALERTWTRSLADLAALRLRWAGEWHDPGGRAPVVHDAVRPHPPDRRLPDVSRRAPRRPVAALRALAESQAETDDPERDAEPGKVVHEIRRGKMVLVWADRYDGTVDATPLFLVLPLGAVALERRRRARARAGRARAPGARLDRRAAPTATATGFVEYLRRGDARSRQPELEKDSRQLDGLP